MDSMITAAARALAAGDPLGALNRVALRNDPPALALRGIAMAQLCDFARARTLLRGAQHAFGPREAVARARCVVAEAEVALVSRDLAWPAKALDVARSTLASHGDDANAAYGGYLVVRRLLLVGRLHEAECALAELNADSLPAALRAVHALTVAGIAMRRVRATQAREALAEARECAREARIPPLMAEVESSLELLDAPAARLVADGDARPLTLAQVETVLASRALVIDACRYSIREGERVVALATRPVLFVLARVLAQSWPADAPRDELVARAFRGVADESHRARLRVEMGRLRTKLRPLADVTATKRGFALVPRRAREVAVLVRPIDEKHAAVLALLADGESWSTSALALALDTSQRNVQRALQALASDGKAQAVGRGRARRWVAPPAPGFATALLLPTQLPGD